ncbi:hypothetical protein KC19_11G050600 [Ceratodon purpureus]|uniref:Uncharacterized protein n=1 Tax=Ceratodon purpureus TaxID=3225 RepID=A0A8T0GCD8_CERPU|nr:hypothetical protein KC19_11G050600 [Ceratodon purpureus]
MKYQTRSEAAPKPKIDLLCVLFSPLPSLQLKSGRQLPARHLKNHCSGGISCDCSPLREGAKPPTSIPASRGFAVRATHLESCLEASRHFARQRCRSYFQAHSITVPIAE